MHNIPHGTQDPEADTAFLEFIESLEKSVPKTKTSARARRKRPKSHPSSKSDRRKRKHSIEDSQEQGKGQVEEATVSTGVGTSHDGDEHETAKGLQNNGPEQGNASSSEKAPKTDRPDGVKKEKPMKKKRAPSKWNLFVRDNKDKVKHLKPRERFKALSEMMKKQNSS